MKNKLNELNRIHNCDNPYQGDYKKVLCVCSAGLLRSPTAALVLSAPPFNFNTRAAGLDESFALIPVDTVLLAWADEIVCMDKGQADRLRAMGFKKNVLVLDIEDSYGYRDPQLIKKITKIAKEHYLS